MYYTPPTSTMRYTLPRADLRSRDRRSGAYPTKKRTGDRTRTGTNKFYFDDTRSVVFSSNVDISLPTTFETGSIHLAQDMTSSFVVTGDVKSYAVDQWIAHRDQVESPGPFDESKFVETDMLSVINSPFLTGVAHRIVPDRFKSKIGNKTIIRIEIPLTSPSVLSTVSSSIHYLNKTTNTFDLVANEESFNYLAGTHPATFAPIPFTPYGLHHIPFRETNSEFDSYYLSVQDAYALSTTLLGDGSDTARFYVEGTKLGTTTSSLLNARHNANSNQLINMSSYIAHPFLLEKAIIEMPFAAGPGWLNDQFQTVMPFVDVDSWVMDTGGPMITCALLRQNKAGTLTREIILSGTITNAWDATTGSYNIHSATTGLSYQDVSITPNGVGHLVKPTIVVTGSALSASNNFYTGSVKMTVEPQVLSHVLRMRASGTLSYFNMFAANNFVGDIYNSQAKYGVSIAYGPLTRNTAKYLQSTRNILGNQLALVPNEVLDPVKNPVPAMDEQYENIPRESAVSYTTKVSFDVAAKSSPSPYLLYPSDDLVFCINKHRSAGLKEVSGWTLNNFPYYTIAHQPYTLCTEHDVQIPTGTLRITLYGDLIKEDREFHDTLNQRLETVELWETIGEEPVLDQFDVTYAEELSGSYLDRNNIFVQVPYMLEIATDNNLFTFTKDVGHFSSQTSTVETRTWGTIGNSNSSVNWVTEKYAYELRKSNKNPAFTSEELMWDTRIPNPSQVAIVCNPQYVLATDVISCLQINSLYSGEISDLHGGPSVGKSSGGIRDWFMTYPYENRYNSVQYTFFQSLVNDVFRHPSVSPHGDFARLELLDYNQLSIELGDLTGTHRSCSRFLASEGVIDSTKWGTGYVPLKKPEFIKYFYGIGDGVGAFDNQHVRRRDAVAAEIRGWRYGMMNAFPVYSNAIFRRDRYGQLRDMLEQRLDAKFYDSNTGVKDSPVQIKFYDAKGKLTDPLLTLSSNVSYEATSSVPYTDDVVRNRSAYDVSTLNIATTTFSS